MSTFDQMLLSSDDEMTHFLLEVVENPNCAFIYIYEPRIKRGGLKLTGKSINQNQMSSIACLGTGCNIPKSKHVKAFEASGGFNSGYWK